MYFKNIPTTLYPFNKGGQDEFILVKDISVNVRFIKEIVSNITLYDEYDMLDGETPEIVSEKFYDSPNYHWVIMLLNDRYDYINDFVVPYNTLVEKTKAKYGAANIYNTHHYVNAAGFVVNSDAVGATPVTNIQYEEDENEKKRRIKIIDKRLLNNIVTQFYKAIA